MPSIRQTIVVSHDHSVVASSSRLIIVEDVLVDVVVDEVEVCEDVGELDDVAVVEAIVPPSIAVKKHDIGLDVHVAHANAVDAAARFLMSSLSVRLSCSSVTSLICGNRRRIIL